jgi:hypothetical protein
MLVAAISRQIDTRQNIFVLCNRQESQPVLICTALYNFQDLTANNGDCVKLPTDIGRPSLSDTYDIRAVTTGSAAISAFLPVFWFIEPTSGEVQFCAVRHAGLCVRMNLPLTARRVFNWPNTVDFPTGYALGRH